MSAPIVVPLIQSGVYRISSAACFPELYLERERDTAIKAVQLNHTSDAQKWMITPDEDGAYKIACVRDGSVIGSSTSLESQGIWSIEPRGHTFIIGNASDGRALTLGADNCVQTSDRNNIRGQRWVLHLFSSDNLPIRAHADHVARALRAGSDSPIQFPPDYNIISDTAAADVKHHPHIRAPNRNAIVQDRTANTNTSTRIPPFPLPWGTTTPGPSGPPEPWTPSNGFYHIVNVKTTGELAVWTGWQISECPITAYPPCKDHGWDQARTFAIFRGEDGGYVIINTYSTKNAPRYVAKGPQAVPAKNVCRLLPVRGKPDVYMICPDMESYPPEVIYDANSGPMDSASLRMAPMKLDDESQMWRFVEI